MGGGDPLLTASSVYLGGGEPNGGEVSLMTRNGLRGGVCDINPRPWSPLRDRVLRVVATELLREGCSGRIGTGWRAGTAAGTGTEGSGMGRW
jgi:hypothetical protein